MTFDRRSACVALLALPAGCAIQPLQPLPKTPIAPPGPAAVALPAPAVGRHWSYRKLNFFNGSVVDEVTETVTAVAPTLRIARRDDGAAPAVLEEHAAWGQLLRESAWDTPMTFESPLPMWPAALAVGASASGNTHYRMDGGSIRFWIQVSAVARQWERVTAAAGSFDTLRVERLIRLEHQDVTRLWTLRRDTMWLSPEVGRWVARETSGEYLTRGEQRFLPSVSREDHVRWELSAWR
jgi:hypothetical protein